MLDIANVSVTIRSNIELAQILEAKLQPSVSQLLVQTRICIPPRVLSLPRWQWYLPSIGMQSLVTPSSVSVIDAIRGSAQTCQSAAVLQVDKLSTYGRQNIT